MIPGKYTRNAHSHDIKLMLGLTVKQKLPNEGMPPRLIHGIEVWVAPLAPRISQDHIERWRRRYAKPHRVLCRCPQCGKVVSVGRLHQHEMVHTTTTGA